MSDLAAAIVAPDALTPADRDAMFTLMETVYDGVTRDAFEQDLAAKHECIVLRAPDGSLAGFSTQRFLTVEVDAARAAPLVGGPGVGVARVAGVFSGDTVVHPAHWGSPALFQAFARRYIRADTAHPWWFLISKGHRTYRMLPTFFQRFWPSRREPTPDAAAAVMAAYAQTLVPGELRDGVLAYRHPKDRLRAGVAGIGQRDLRVPDVAFFAAANPHWASGHDLVCLAALHPDNLKPAVRPLLLGRPAGRGRGTP